MRTPMGAGGDGGGDTHTPVQSPDVSVALPLPKSWTLLVRVRFTALLVVIRRNRCTSTMFRLRMRTVRTT